MLLLFRLCKVIFFPRLRHHQVQIFASPIIQTKRVSRKDIPTSSLSTIDELNKPFCCIVGLACLVEAGRVEDSTFMENTMQAHRR